MTCEESTFCENTPGSYRCKACHVACLGGCRGAGPAKCVECKDGFNMDDGECKGQLCSRHMHTHTHTHTHTHIPTHTHTHSDTHTHTHTLTQ